MKQKWMALLITVLLQLQIPARAADLATLTSTYRDATVFLVVRASDEQGEEITNRGSGFLISSSWYILTNYHVLADARGNALREMKIRGKKGDAFDPEDPTGVIIEIQLVRFDPVQDVALLKAKEIDGPHNFVRACRETQITEGKPIFIFGYDLALGLKPSPGTLSRKDADRAYWQFDAQTEVGSSGGPILNESGRLIGINWGGVEGAEGINLMIPIQHAYDYFAAAGASLDYCRTTDGLEAEGACLPKVHVYEVDEMQAEHDKIGTSTRMVTKEFPALEGFRIISWEWVSASSANSSEVVLTPIGDGGSLRMNVALSSGPFYDRWRGWVSGKILTKQEQVGCGGEGQPQE